ncbi:hypothetical protein M0R04_14865 [Candidatus Dojkabacteria bacterium]|jgi:hypothetical protein|nr:hypothetical protein [Candidatus Dojkabacteria bacterium]
MSRLDTNIKDFLQLTQEEQVGTGECGKWGVWYDWFCCDSALVRRGKSLVSKLKSIQHSKRFDPENTYVFFKNNCPMDGSLYDDFRICDIKTGDVIFTIVPKSGHTSDNGLGAIWGYSESGREIDELFTGSWEEIKAWFNDFDPDAE